MFALSVDYDTTGHTEEGGGGEKTHTQQNVCDWETGQVWAETRSMVKKKQKQPV